MSDTVIELNHITHKFTHKEVLSKISLKISKGEIFGLLGPSGAGKTTLIHILTGQLMQTAGSAMILGENTNHISGVTYKKIGMMMDKSGLCERLTCYDNLLLFARIYGIPKNRINEILERVGLEEAIKRPVMKLSKGMTQRLILARAIIANPSILFLDEPTSGLDPATSAQIHEMIREQRDRGASVFLTTHNMEEATKLCDNIALLHEGNIVEYGAPKEICRKYNHQNKLRLLLHNGELIELPNDKMAAETVSRYLKQESIETIHSTEPNLESVFMELTGRGLE